MPDLLDDVVVVVTGGEVMGNEPGLAALLDGCFRLGMWLELRNRKFERDSDAKKEGGFKKRNGASRLSLLVNAVERRHTQKVCERQLKEMQRKVEVSEELWCPTTR